MVLVFCLLVIGLLVIDFLTVFIKIILLRYNTYNNCEYSNRITEWVVSYVYSMRPSPNQDNERIYYPKSLLLSLCNQFLEHSLSSPGNHWYFFCHYRLGCIFQNFEWNFLKHTVFFVWLFWLNIIVLRFMHIVLRCF